MFTSSSSSPVCQKQSDVVFVVDSSSSIWYDDFQRIKEFLVSVVDAMDVDTGTTHVGFIQFSDDITELFGLATYDFA